MNFMSTEISSWQDWDYDEWNQRLLDYYFRPTATSPIHEPVERLHVSLSELVVIAEADEKQIDEIGKQFIDLVKRRLGKRGLLTFCKRTKSGEAWDLTSEQQPPHFFSLLWLTCLVAQGHPAPERGFHENWKDILRVKKEVTELHDCWVLFANWSRVARKQQTYREVLLPGELGVRTNIGDSYYLAFPGQYDRKRLLEYLGSHNLRGRELPAARPILELFSKAKHKFSPEFRDWLSTLNDEFKKLGDTVDFRRKPLWRAIEELALNSNLLSILCSNDIITCHPRRHKR